MSDLSRTPLYALHLELGAKMVPFAGYEMPVQYPAGLMSEHKHCRDSAALFDVSHMGQVRLTGPGAAAALERLVPVDVIGLGQNKQRYGFFTLASGGILDDLMITHRQIGGQEDWLVVVNGACKAADLEHMQRHLTAHCTMEYLPDQALLALQGPKAVDALARLAPELKSLVFMTGASVSLCGVECYVTRSGYTGEDGFEISVPADHATALARELLAQPEVKPAGLGARDSLRLEAGLCLYGHDLSTETSPIEAGLNWAIQKVRRAGGDRAGGYPGAELIDAQLSGALTRKRVGLAGLERAPVREGTALFNADGEAIGTVCSGTFGPSVQQPVAMAYLPLAYTALDTMVFAEVRGKRMPMKVSAMPFAPHRYFRG